MANEDYTGTEGYIGARVKKIRVKKDMTQQHVADLCGLSKGMISKIECGKVMPTIATLTKIAHALQVKVSLLMEDGSERIPACQSTSISPMRFTATDVGYRFFSLAAEYGDKSIQPLIFYASNTEVNSHRVSHEGEECIFIIEGEMVFNINESSYFLKQGDFLYFDGRQPHGIEKVEHEVRYLNIFTAGEYASQVFIDN